MSLLSMSWLLMCFNDVVGVVNVNQVIEWTLLIFCQGMSSTQLLRKVYKEGHMFRGLGWGLSRSVIANGCALHVYTEYQRGIRAVLQNKP